ncbi:MAG: efflux RND transporter periplasmic adaptor subunit, partial [Chloroflexi bacterium]|nr:efflux RND transporter periplasmic adaptor subunit [Chloroflexota bacterium]
MKLKELVAKRKRLLIVGVVVLAGLGAWFLLNQSGAAPVAVPWAASEQDGLTASGVIEAYEVAVVAETPGTIRAFAAREGDEVHQGDVVVQLDDDLYRANLERTQSYVALAQANLALVKAGARPEEVAANQAQLHVVEAKRDAAKTAWENAIIARDNPQELDVQLTAAQAQVQVAEGQLAAKLSTKDSTEAGWGYAVRLDGRVPDTWSYTFDPTGLGIDIVFGTPWGTWDPTIPDFLKFDVTVSGATPASLKKAIDTQARLADFGRWLAWEDVHIAQAELDGAQAQLRVLRDIRANPLQANLQVDAAKAQYDMAVTEVAAAQAKLDGLLAGPTTEQVAAAQAQVTQAQAAHEALQVQVDKLTLRAPIDGLVLSRAARQGEVAVAGRTLMTIGDLDRMTLTVYVPATEVGRIQLGQPVPVTVDSYSDRVFSGQVVHIADEAEFTPRNVETKESRAETVFAVQIALENPDHILKPGMPADAQIGNPKTRAPNSNLIGEWAQSVGAGRGDSSPDIAGSGTIEAEEVVVTTLVAGRVNTVYAHQGDTVQAGDTLVQLDTALIDAQIKQAEAAVAGAEAQLAQARAGATPSQVAAMEAQLAQATAAQAGTQQALTDLDAIRAHPQELDLQIEKTRAQWHEAQRQVQQARAAMLMSEALRDRAKELAYYPGTDAAKSMYESAQARYTAAVATYETAITGEKATKKALDQLIVIRSNPQSVDAEVDKVKGQYAQATAAVGAAQAGVTAVKAGATAEQIALAQANVRQKEAEVHALEAQWAKMTLRAPVSGIVL